MTDEINGKKPPAVTVINRVVLSKAFMTSDASLKAIAENYVKKTNEFGKLLKEVKEASKALKDALEPKLTNKGVDVKAGTDWRATEGDEKGTIIVEVLKKTKAEGSRSRVPTQSI